MSGQCLTFKRSTMWTHSPSSCTSVVGSRKQARTSEQIRHAGSAQAQVSERFSRPRCTVDAPCMLSCPLGRGFWLSRFVRPSPRGSANHADSRRRTRATDASLAAPRTGLDIYTAGSKRNILGCCGGLDLDPNAVLREMPSGTGFLLWSFQEYFVSGGLIN